MINILFKIFYLQIALFSIALLFLIALSYAAPTEDKPAEGLESHPERDDLAVDDKEDLKTAASHWGGYGHYGGHFGGHYPHYGYWGYPSYSYGYGYGWPYGIYGGYGGYGGYGHHGYWW